MAWPTTDRCVRDLRAESCKEGIMGAVKLHAVQQSSCMRFSSQAACGSAVKLHAVVITLVTWAVKLHAVLEAGRCCYSQA
jgi:positive regulator of sigma E activity